MPGVRDHAPFVIEQFGGLWARGDGESCPSDHFLQADNIQYFNSGFETRDPVSGYYQVPGVVVANKVLRIYDYVTQSGPTILMLTQGGVIWHMTSAGTILGPVLQISAMEDFGFVAIAGRAYITPFKTFVNSQGQSYELGLPGEFLYVYNGDGNPARKAAGNPPTGAPTIAMGAAGNTDAGFHIMAVIYETDSGYLTAPGVPAGVSFTGTNKINITNIPVSPDAFVKKRHIISTKAIADFNTDPYGYQFFFVPKGAIDNNTATTITVEFFDSDLLSDASHLIDNFSEIPAGVALNTYHSRLVLVGDGSVNKDAAGIVDIMNPDNRSVARVSMPGEPEAINKIDGLIIAPLDGNPLTNCQEFRDILYLFKKTRTYGYSDNNDEPSTWREEVIDQGVGSPVHGIGTVLDSGGVNIDFLLIADMSGLMMFNGTYARPELSWKIEDFWMSLDRESFRYIQVVNDSLGKKIWITLPSGKRTTVLHANYGEGLDARNIKWAKWIFETEMTTACLILSDKLVIGSNGATYSGLYYVHKNKVGQHDTYYNRTGQLVDRKIPDPIVRTAFFGE